MFETEEKTLDEILEKNIYPVLPSKITSILKKVNISDICGIEEIRLRADKPLMIYKGGSDYFISNNGNISKLPSSCLVTSISDIEKTLQLMCDFSIYAVEEELKQGFLTLSGGHRVGITGRVVLEGNKIKTVRNISGMNIRIAREVKGCGRELIELLYKDGLKHTLISSPPGCGKTTLLRDMVRIISNGDRNLNIKGYKVGIVDERSEIAGCYLGIPQKDVGTRTDVLDACPKAQGMIMLLRSMSPEVIAVDEIGSIEDSMAIEDAINSGVKVIATVHGRDMAEMMKKPGIKNLMDRNAFEKIVILSRKRGPGTIENIIDSTNSR